MIVSGSEIEIEAPDGTANAYLAQPAEVERPPGVLLAIDAYGVRPQITAMADRIAAEGFAVLAPNLFYRDGRAPVPPMPQSDAPDARAKFFEQLRPLLDSLTPERITADGAAYLDALERFAQPPFGITGYCMGSRVGLRIAAAYPERVAALGAFHGGRFVTDDPDSPHLLAPRLKAELYLGHADEDQSNPPEQIAALDEALAEAGVRHRSEVYSGARHGYTMADTPVYDETASERHFAALFDLLKRTLPDPA
jgi:carboxymethylenebutenolidase